jgi:hypothetical protein
VASPPIFFLPFFEQDPHMDSPEAIQVKQFPDQIKLLFFVPEFLGQNGNNLLEKNCFGPNQNVLLSL